MLNSIEYLLYNGLVNIRTWMEFSVQVRYSRTESLSCSLWAKNR